MKARLKRVRIVGDGQFTKVFDVATGEEIHFVQRLEFEQSIEKNGLHGKPLVKITTLAIGDRIDVVGITPDNPPPPTEEEIDAEIEQLFGQSVLSDHH